MSWINCLLVKPMVSMKEVVANHFSINLDNDMMLYDHSFFFLLILLNSFTRYTGTKICTYIHTVFTNVYM